MNLRRTGLVLLVLAGAAVAVLAGIGTGESFEDSGSLWGEPDAAVIDSEIGSQQER